LSPAHLITLSEPCISETIRIRYGHKDKIPALEKIQNQTLSFFDVIIKLLEDNATVDEARATLKEAGII